MIIFHDNIFMIIIIRLLHSQISLTTSLISMILSIGIFNLITKDLIKEYVNYY